VVEVNFLRDFFLGPRMQSVHAMNAAKLGPIAGCRYTLP